MQTLVLERKSFMRDFALVLIASFLICLFGHISIPLWFTPVPIATQNSAVLLIAAMLGSRRGTAAVLAFLAQGAMGLPVFSNGVGGFHHFFGPTGGYLIGYAVAAFVVGLIAEKSQKSIGNVILALSVGNLIIYLLGACYLAFFVGYEKALLLGVVPFIPGDVLKVIVSLKILHWMRRKEIQ